MANTVCKHSTHKPLIKLRHSAKRARCMPAAKDWLPVMHMRSAWPCRTGLY